MLRGPTGRYEVTAVGGERVNAFVPVPLPPAPMLDLRTLQVALERALVALGRLDGLSAFLPDPHFFIYGYVRKEAVLSSQISVQGVCPAVHGLWTGVDRWNPWRALSGD